MIAGLRRAIPCCCNRAQVASTSTRASSAAAGGRVAIDIENIHFRCPPGWRASTSVARIRMTSRSLEESCRNRALNPDADLHDRDRVPPEGRGLPERARCSCGRRSASTRRRSIGAVWLVTNRASRSPASTRGGRREPPSARSGHWLPRRIDRVDRLRRRFAAVRERAHRRGRVVPNAARAAITRIRAGERRLVATSTGNAVATAPITIERRPSFDTAQADSPATAGSRPR